MSLFLCTLDSSLSRVIPSEPVEVLGAWSAATRRTCQPESQPAGGAGPSLEVEDRRWQGTLTCRIPVGAVVFLTTPTKIYWAKAPTIAPILPVEVSLSAYVGHGARATFTARLAGAHLPGVAVASPAGLEQVCPRGLVTFTTGRVVTIAQANEVVFAVVVLPRSVLKMGRKHLWRLRDDVASSLPPDARELLTGSRSGDRSELL